MGPDKLIIRSEKARLTDILSLLLLRRPFTSYPFVEAGDQTVADLGSTPGGWFLGLTLLIQKFLCAIYWPSWCIGVAVEFLLNFVALNSGILGIIWNIFRCKLVIPWDREAPEFRSIIGLIDGRTELKPQPPPASSRGDHHERRRLQVVGISGNRGVEECAGLESGERGNATTTTTTVPLVQQRYSLHEVTVMAAKIAYENAAYIENVVNNVWKFHFVGFYSCWNKFMWKDGAYTTQAFVMTDSSSDARVVVVSFRGTELFNTRDWSTDVDLSWLGLGAMGCVHVGFLKALGLQEEDDVDPARAFPRDLPNNDAAAAAVGNNERPVAYYKLREVLREQLKKHPRARVVVTGHSLGGALAAIFPALLAFHGEDDVLRRLLAVHTYGQPRVGDAAFAAFCRGRDPLRVVYRYDLIPRVPWDLPPLARFRHGGACVYFDGWYRGRELPAGADVPNRNYVDPGYLLPMYGEAAADLVRGAVLWVWEGRDYREGAASLLFRAAGLVVPGVASHSPRDCVNAVRLGPVARKEA
ncbi:hypothetical protein U9M48_036660 [Paspalum notatum var. saurae]|uniref:Fungal lipase-type domain-containing protein n=1 Tax=Paspalum notatum var. saurae TaxID=547442 RepID=A0AAQ3X8I2_PASNO